MIIIQLHLSMAQLSYETLKWMHDQDITKQQDKVLYISCVGHICDHVATYLETDTHVDPATKASADGARRQPQ